MGVATYLSDRHLIGRDGAGPKGPRVALMVNRSHRSAFWSPWPLLRAQLTTTARAL